MLHDQVEIEQAEHVLSTLKNPGRLEILALVRNQVYKMTLSEKYSESPAAQEVLQDLLHFLWPVVETELTVFGDSVAMSYMHVLPDAMSVEEAEIRAGRSQQVTDGESVRVDA